MLVWTADGEGYFRVQSAVKDAGLWNLFYLEGGTEAYRRAEANLVAMHARNQQRRHEKPGSCPARR